MGYYKLSCTKSYNGRYTGILYDAFLTLEPNLLFKISGLRPRAGHQKFEASGVYVVQLFFLPITGQIFGDQP